MSCMSTQKIRLANIEARWMLNNIVADSGGNIAFPVDVHRIIDVLDIVLDVVEPANGSHNTISWREQNQRACITTVCADDTDMQLRYELAVAVALIHYTNATKGKRVAMDIDLDDDSEAMRFARGFARELLAPARDVIQRHNNGFNVGALSRIFLVPESVVAAILLDS